MGMGGACAVHPPRKLPADHRFGCAVVAGVLLYTGGSALRAVVRCDRVLRTGARGRRGPVDRLPGGAHRRGRCGALRAGGHDFGPLPGQLGLRARAGPGAGGDWDFDGPGHPSADLQAPSTPISVSNGSNTAVSEDAYTNGVYVLDSGADIVEVHGTGHLRIGDGTVDMVVPGTSLVCTTDKGCGPCPDGQKPSIQPARLGATSLLAVSGGTDGASAVVSGHPLEEFCKATSKVCESG